MSKDLQHGIRANLGQFLHQLLQVLLVGLTIGMMRTVVPALAESEFGVPRNSFVLLSAFVVAFGIVKGIMNFVAGRLSERIGRKRVLLLGWVVALPIPVMIWHAPDWNWIVAATVLLGVNQGLTWSMTQTSKLDIIRLDERGLALGLNEFAGYVGVALAGVLTAYLATMLGARDGLLVFGLAVTVLALVLTQRWVEDTLPWAQAEAARHKPGKVLDVRPRYPKHVSAQPGTWEIFTLMSWRDKRLLALSQAGLVEKFVDALVWVFYPVFLYQQGVSLPNVGWIISVYGFVWGGSQLFTGRLSDRIGRRNRLDRRFALPHLVSPQVWLKPAPSLPLRLVETGQLRKIGLMTSAAPDPGLGLAPCRAHHKKNRTKARFFCVGRRLVYSFCACMNWSKRISVKRNHRFWSRRNTDQSS